MEKVLAKMDEPHILSALLITTESSRQGDKITTATVHLRNWK